MASKTKNSSLDISSGIVSQVSEEPKNCDVGCQSSDVKKSCSLSDLHSDSQISIGEGVTSKNVSVKLCEELPTGELLRSNSELRGTVVAKSPCELAPNFSKSAGLTTGQENQELKTTELKSKLTQFHIGVKENISVTKRATITIIKQPSDSEIPPNLVGPINNLPDEMLMAIFHFLNPVELCRHVTRVCRRWYDLAFTHCLWTRLDASRCRLCDCLVIKKVHGAVKSLNISQGLSDASVATVMENCPELVNLTMNGVANLSVSMLRSVMSHCPKLQSLEIMRCSRLYHTCIQEIVSGTCVSGEEPSLSRISLDGSSLTDDSVKLILSSVHKVTHFTLDPLPQVSEKTIQLAIETYSSTLEALTLDGRNLTDSGISPLKSCKALHSLSISGCQLFTHQCFVSLLKLKLSKLVLQQAVLLRARALMEFFSTNNLHGLTYLDLTGCTDLDDDGLQAISQTSADNLQTLCLSWCVNISDEGLNHVACGCKSIKRLELIALNRLRGSWLSTAVYNMNRLSFITFQLCQNVRLSLLELIVKMQPRLTILNYFGNKVVPSS